MRASPILGLVSYIPVAVSQVGNTNPTYVPKAGFPGQTAAETNALWPSGKQPVRLAQWPQTAPDPTTGEPTLLECWQVKVLRDFNIGWPGMCEGLFKQPTLSTEAACQSACVKEARCPMWQYTIQETPNQCWLGYGASCHGNANLNKYIRIGGAQRLQHGKVRVLANVANFEILNMYLLGVLEGCHGQDCVTRCRDWCYSDIGCQYWQYGANGCYVDAPYKTWPNQVQYPLTASGISTTSIAAHTMLAGEYIQHYCPTAGPATPIPLPTVSPTAQAIQARTFTPAPTLMPTRQPTLAPSSGAGSSGSAGSGDSGSGRSGDSGSGDSGSGDSGTSGSSGSSDSGPSDPGSGDSSGSGSSGGSGDSGSGSGNSGSSGSGTSGQSSGSGSLGIEWWLWALHALLLLLLVAFCAGLLLCAKKPKKKKRTRAVELREDEGPFMMQQRQGPEPMHIQPPPPIVYASPSAPVQQTLVAPPVYVATPTTTFMAPPTTIVAAPPTTTYTAASRAVVIQEVSKVAPVYRAPTRTVAEPIVTGQMYPMMRPQFMQ